ncbi:MAG: purine-binding chemotaxis protein CheW [Nitrospirae bacterium]|nr:purine-binding chemotaxis protein CheW [Nitrospirota bacterium]
MSAQTATTTRQPDEAAAPSSAQWLVCRVAQEHYLIDVSTIKEIIRPPELTTVPRSPAWLKGICSLRGVVVAVIDLGRRLGMTDRAPTPKNRVVVLATAKGLGGLLVDSVQGLIDLETHQIDPPPPLLAAPHRELLRGIVHRNGRTFALLDVSRIVAFPPAGRD